MIKIFNICIMNEQELWKQRICEYKDGRAKGQSIVNEIANVFFKHILKSLDELRKNTWDKERVDNIKMQIESFMGVKK